MFHLDCSMLSEYYVHVFQIYYCVKIQYNGVNILEIETDIAMQKKKDASIVLFLIQEK